MSMIGPVQSRCHEGSPVGKRSLRWEGFVENTHSHIRLLNKRLTDRNLNNEIVNIVVTAQSLINVTVKIFVNKISIKEMCSTFWKQSIMFAWSEVVVFRSCGDCFSAVLTCP